MSMQALKVESEDDAQEEVQDDRIATLKNFPLFSDLNDEELSHISDVMEEVELEPGKTILTQNEPASAVYFLLHGAVKILINGEMVAKVDTVQCFGEMSCLIPDTPASASVETAQTSKVFKIDKGPFLEAVNQIPKLWRSLFLQMNTRFKAVNMRLSEVLEHSPEGLLRVDQNCVISNEYSIVCTEYFEHNDLAGLSFCDLIIEDAELRPTWMQTFALLFDESTLPFNDIADLLTKELDMPHKDGTHREFVFSYYPCRAIDGSISAIDIGMKDVTQARDLERKNVAMVSEQNMLGKIYENPESFIHLRTFIIETIDETMNLVKLFRNKSPSELEDVMTSTMRKLHSLKGYAGIFAIEPVQKSTHNLEGLIKDQEDVDKVSGEDLTKLLNGLIRLKDDYQFTEELFNRIGAGLRKRLMGITLTFDQFEILKSVTESGDTKEIQKIIHNAEMVPTKKLVAHWEDESQRLAVSMGKVVNFSLQDNGELLSKTVFNQLDEVLIHLLRNSIDHGLESPEERAALDKPDAGNITVCIDQEDDILKIVIEDDGKGIDVSTLADKARGIKHLNQDTIEKHVKNGEEWKILLMSGFSTAKEVTEISGRGVGLDAVSEQVKKIDGKLTLDTEFGVKTVITITVPLN